MSRRNENHRVARIIKQLEERISDLEEKDRSTTTPTLLRTVTDGLVCGEGTITVTSKSLSTARWSSPSTSDDDDSGWRTATWGGDQ